MNSFLKWAGSKRKLLGKISGFCPPEFDRYVEPFAGSACLFFSLQPATALLADINEELVATYQELQKNVEFVIAELSEMKCDKDFYYSVRSQNPKQLAGPKRAARFIFLNRFCFNGLYRTNRAGVFNVPFGGEKSGQLPSSDEILVGLVTRDCWWCSLIDALIIRFRFCMLSIPNGMGFFLVMTNVFRVVPN